MRHSKRGGPTQLELPFGPLPDEAPRPAAQETPPAPKPAATAEPAADSSERVSRLIRGGGERIQEPLATRDAVVRVLVEAGADLLLRRITPERAEHIERSVDQILDLFDRVDAVPQLMPVLKRQLDDLEALMVETRAQRSRRQG